MSRSVVDAKTNNQAELAIENEIRGLHASIRTEQDVPADGFVGSFGFNDF